MGVTCPPSRCSPRSGSIVDSAVDQEALWRGCWPKGIQPRYIPLAEPCLQWCLPPTLRRGWEAPAGAPRRIHARWWRCPASSECCLKVRQKRDRSPPLPVHHFCPTSCNANEDPLGRQVSCNYVSNPFQGGILKWYSAGSCDGQ